MKMPIHIWQIELDSYQTKIPEMMLMLSHEERYQAQQFRFVQDQQRYVISHGCLRMILGQYLHIAPQEVQLGVQAAGKPVVKFPKQPVIHFNLTHAGQLAAVAVSEKPVGVDIEQIDHNMRFDEVVPQFMSVHEQAIFRRLPMNLKATAFYCCWTRKEAYVKALGKGLGYPIKQVTVSLSQQIEPWKDEYDPDEQKKWHMFHLKVPHGYMGAVVGQEKELDLFTMDKQIVSE